MTEILLVEDDESLVRLLGALLEQEGFKVQMATNGDRALRKLEKWLPDLVICDIQMPVLDGFGLLKEVRNNEHWKQLPFIFLTGIESEEKRELSKQLGADDYLTKPINRDQLLQAISLRLGKQVSLTSLNSNRSDNRLLLHLAAANGDLESLKERAAQVDDIDMTDAQGNTALMFAIMMRQVEAAHFLMRQGANPDLRHPATGMRIGAMARAMGLDF
ncbi:Ankyrin repeat-containing protein [Marinospirillum celere]|uniref:Ankyrin repeat-containing protein n=1 Tax=Marinospirillum celere TaxID=1122252 RepID=A0A1I1J711_9GAMM|nr:response regulator [Marinospirillum celere]SFC44165.1 Ankyrin repeat-containing protein [Marinospirillum celere]